MVDKLRRLFQRLSAAQGHVSLAVMFREDAASSNWTLLIAAEWADRMPVAEAIRFMVISLRSTLQQHELGQIGSINFLNSDSALVSELAGTVPRDQFGRIIRSIPWAGKVYAEMIVIRLGDDYETGARQTRVASRDPRYNSSINPRYNSSINPRYNSSINPRYNSSINPRYNSSINPRYNSSINPRYNSSINPRYNSSINPRYNSSINPRYNSSINPRYNPNFQGYLLYDLKTYEPKGFIVNVSEVVSMHYGLNMDWMGYSVARENILNIFDTENEWVGYFIKSRTSTYDFFNQFSVDGDWQGFAV